jgi:hypothetical protein
VGFAQIVVVVLYSARIAREQTGKIPRLYKTHLQTKRLWQDHLDSKLKA